MENQKLDTKGEVCPMPVALTKRKLESMEPGQILEVLGDCAPAFANIQKWAKSQGYEIVGVSQSKVDFIIKIKKH